MKKFIFLCIMTVFVMIAFNTIAMPFISAYFQPDNMAFVNNQLSNDGIMSSAAIQTGMMFDTIISMAINLVLLISLGFFIYKAYEGYVANNN